MPGDGGSQLLAKGDKPQVVHFFCQKQFDWSQLWLSVTSLLPGAIDCWCDNIRLVFDAVTGTYTNSPGIQVQVPGFGNTTTIEYLDESLQITATQYMHPLVQHLVDTLHLQRGQNIHGAPYDFRLAPRSQTNWIQSLKTLIETTYTQNNNQAIVLLGHSMGCRYTLEFLHQQTDAWKQQYIHAYVPVSGVWAGTAKIYSLQSSGDAQGVPGVTGITIRGEQRTYESNAYLMPSPNVWLDDPIIITENRTYTAGQAVELFQDLNFPQGAQMYNLVKDTTPFTQPPNVLTFCVYGNNVSTPEHFVYAPGAFPDGQPTVRYSLDGDGTVNAKSLQQCAQWPQTKVIEIPNVSHTDALSHPTLWDLLVSLIQS